jgi:uncharacterized protein (DUF1499 family)
MTDSAIAGSRGNRLFALAPRVALVLLAAAVLLLIAVPFGWRFHLWHFRLSFQMVAWARDLAIAAAVVAAIGILFARAALGRSGKMLAAAVLVVGIGMVYVPWQWAQLHGGPYPPINDITTDSANPPQFVAALPARAAEQAVSAAYGGAATAQLQQTAYPDIAPAIVTAAPAEAFARALAAARAMRGWSILTGDPKRGIIEASDTTFYFGFTDDIVIRVTPDGAGSRIDIRSHSRQGRGDFGVNAARVRKYLAALKAAG